jgi:hypothetical protein
MHVRSMHELGLRLFNGNSPYRKTRTFEARKPRTPGAVRFYGHAPALGCRPIILMGIPVGFILLHPPPPLPLFPRPAAVDRIQGRGGGVAGGGGITDVSELNFGFTISSQGYSE